MKSLPALPGGPALEAPRPPQRSGSAPSEPHVLSDSDGISRYMAVGRPIAVRAEPSLRSKIVARLSTRTPEGTTNVVLALKRTERRGRIWIQARLPVLPNNTLGWIPREAIGGYNEVNAHLVVSLWASAQPCTGADA